MSKLLTRIVLCFVFLAPIPFVLINIHFPIEILGLYYCSITIICALIANTKITKDSVKEHIRINQDFNKRLDAYINAIANSEQVDQFDFEPTKLDREIAKCKNVIAITTRKRR